MLEPAEPVPDPASLRARVRQAGLWLGTLDARNALEQDAAILTVATLAHLDIEATRRAFRSRYWGPAVERDPGLA